MTTLTHQTKGENYFCIILAGGRGRRLWPCSRDAKPKQFLDFFGTGETLLQQTYKRFLKIIPKDRIYVSTNRDYLDYIHQQLPDVPETQILAEPIQRNTAPSVTWATHRILKICPEANIVVTPADQVILNEEAFNEDILKGLEFVSTHQSLLTMGITPTRPEPGYGYIQMGESQDEHIYKVQAFTEKPDRHFAEIFMNSGEWLWNTGLFLSNARYLMDCVYEFLPVVLRDFDKNHDHWTLEEENEYMQDNFPSYPNLSIDYGILEKSNNVYVMNCHFGWADLGTWHSIYESMSQSKDENVVIHTDAVIDNATGNLVCVPGNKLAVINGLNDCIIVENDNVLLVCKKEDSSALIRKYINTIQLQKGDDYI